ncbi:MAG TPA: tail fiber protein [Thermomicrobiales bacterium]|nr:tail fiber protein [Thermomicrobiales bacterium]
MPYPGEIRLFAGNVPPAGWAFCHGQTARIDAAPRLYAAIGTRFGGDGRESFRLPDLRGRVPVHRSERVAHGGSGGAEAVALAGSEIPTHAHGLPLAAAAGAGARSSGRALNVATGTGGVAVALGTMTSSGLGTTHPNVQPYLALNYVIALDDGAGGPLLGEVRLFAGADAPDGWARCDGQSLKVGAFGDLYSVLGTTYGGDGRRTFALPDLRGRVAMQAGRGPGLTTRRLGETGGETLVALREDQLPQHEHAAEVRAAAVEGGRTLLAAAGRGVTVTAAVADEHRMVAVATGASGASGAHDNLQPYLTLTYIIACQGRLPEPD